MNELSITTGSLPADSAIADRLRSAVADARTENTRRAYAAAWKAWAAFAAAHGQPELPAAPEMVAAFLAARAEDGVSMATIRQAATAIGKAHELAGQPNPCADRTVREVMRGLARQAAGRPERQARALDAEAVAAIRGSLNGDAETNLRSAVTMAIVSVMSDAGLRRSEAAVLQWADVHREADGSGRIQIAKSKTDQEGEGATVAITAAAMNDLERVARLRGSQDGLVFQLSDRQIARRIQRAAAKAGLGDGFSGHSGRVGCAVRTTRNQAPTAAVQRQGRWSSSRMVSRYTRNEAAGEALRYL